MKYIREHLGAKLFLANLIVVLIGVIILAITFRSPFPRRSIGIWA